MCGILTATERVFDVGVIFYSLVGYVLGVVVLAVTWVMIERHKDAIQKR